MNREIQKLVLVRHGLSSANVDPTLYLRVPDHRIPLADPEADPACIAAGEHIRALGLGAEEVCIWYSPYVRCLQTEQLVMRHAFPQAHAGMRRRESFLLREQEFGDWDGLSETEIAARHPGHFEKRKRMADEYGRFYFRFPNGESRADVVERVTLFLGKIQRSSFPVHVLFLHGVTQRSFRMAWHNYPVDWFEHETNPANASVLLIERDLVSGRWCERYL